MELTAEIFEETVGLLKGDGGSGKQNKRVYPRVGVRCRVKFIPTGGAAGNKPIEAWTRDISRGGIGFVCSHQINVGSRYTLNLARVTGVKPLSLLCTVKNCEELAPGIYAIGTIFDIPNAEAATPPAATPQTAAPPSAKSEETKPKEAKPKAA